MESVQFIGSPGDAQFFVGGDDPHADLGIRGADDRLPVAGLVLGFVQAHAQRGQFVADHAADAGRMFADARREHEIVQPPQIEV